jgi:hypothetical protein
MRHDVITQIVPGADPEFVRTLENLPDPPPGIYEQVVKALPLLHGVFLRKREAFARDDAAALAGILDEEAELLKRLVKAG